ncbi:hypothetical protein L602_000800000820 [Cupriavidus gilardii J11]|uniref:Glycosyl transferase family 2 n=1 Tax=Cupriavidus gilardii J11 TaxID=936133 RepID=A0A562B1N2_9BURK|nr:hypothetical protein [Cupriavidus gilardii]TWG79013.1 hypothetical protein L602_000800000820 [Cupriavidus gilardii J11]
MDSRASDGPPTSVLVASPIYNDQCYGSYTHSLLQLQAACHQQGIGFEYAWTKSSSLITIARNLLADWFLKRTRCTHLLFIDADMVFRSADVLKMLQADLDVIAAMCPRKEINWANVASAARHRPDMDPRDLARVSGSYGTFQLAGAGNRFSVQTPVEVERIGTGIMLIKRHVLECMAMKYPDATMRAPDRSGDERMHVFFDLGRDEHGDMLSEDIMFCKRWRDLGGKVFGAPWFEVGHIGSHEFRGSLFDIAAVPDAVV